MSLLPSNLKKAEEIIIWMVPTIASECKYFGAFSIDLHKDNFHGVAHKDGISNFTIPSEKTK